MASWWKFRTLLITVNPMKRRAFVAGLITLGALTPLTGTALSSSPASAIALPSGMVLSGQVEPANPVASVKSVSISAQDGETGRATLTTTGTRTTFEYRFKAAGPGRVTWRVTTSSGSFAGNLSTGPLNPSRVGGTILERNLCERACSQPVHQPMVL